MIEISEENYNRLLSDHRKWGLLKTVNLSTGKFQVKNAKEHNKMLEAVVGLVEDDVNKMGEATGNLIKKGFVL